MTESPQDGNGFDEDQAAEPWPQPYDRPVPPPPAANRAQQPTHYPTQPGQQAGQQLYGPPPGWAQPGQYGPSAATFGQPYGQAQPHGQGQPFGPGQGPHPVYGPGPGYGPPPGYGLPQYPFPGQPYGPGSAPPKRKRRLARALGLVALVVLVVAGVAVVLTVGPTVLSRTAVEHDVAAQFRQLEGVGLELHCPKRMKVESGARYTCTGTTAEGEKVTLAIHIQSTGSRPTYVWTEP